MNVYVASLSACIIPFGKKEEKTSMNVKLFTSTSSYATKMSCAYALEHLSSMRLSTLLSKVSHWLLVRKHCVIFLPVTAKWELIQTAKKFGKKYAVSLSPDMESWHYVQKLDRYAMPTILLLSMMEIVLNMERRTE